MISFLSLVQTCSQTFFSVLSSISSPPPCSAPGSGADLQLTLLHGLVVAVLLLHGEGNLIGELLAPLVSTGLAQLLAHLPGGVVALLGWSLLASHGSLAVLGLVLVAVEVDGEDAGPVLDDLLLVPAVLVVNVHALEVVLGGDGQVVHGVTDAVRHLSAPLYSVGFVDHLVLHVLPELADELSHVEALPLLVLINHGGTVLLEHALAQFLLLGEAGLLYVGDTLVHVGQLLHGVAVILVGRLVHLVRGVQGGQQG